MAERKEDAPQNAKPLLDKEALLALLRDSDVRAAVVRVVVDAKRREPHLLR